MWPFLWLVGDFHEMLTDSRGEGRRQLERTSTTKHSHDTHSTMHFHAHILYKGRTSVNQQRINTSRHRLRKEKDACAHRIIRAADVNLQNPIRRRQILDKYLLFLKC